MTEFEMIMKAALQALERGETVALASVIQVRGSAPRHAGARRIVPSRWLGVDVGRSDAPAHILARTLSQ